MSFLQLPAEPMFQPYDHDPTPVSPQDYQGIALMGRSMSFSGMERCGELIARDGGEDEMSDEGVVGVGEKKRRLNLEQVKALEKSFELGNKLEAERKMQLARALGLQPRQIAIWFQNRRARWKTKQLQRDYDILKTQFDALKSDNHSLKSLNNKLHRQLLVLKGRESGSDENRTINLNKQTHQGTSCWSNGSENSCDRVNTTGGLFLQISSSSTTPDLILQSHHQRMNPDETLCSMFNGLDDHPPGFWPWPPHHRHQNFHG